MNTRNGAQSVAESEVLLHLGAGLLPCGEPRNLQVHAVDLRWTLPGSVPDGRGHAGGARAPHSSLLRGNAGAHGDSWPMSSFSLFAKRCDAACADAA